jgi:hypothetical protein
LPDFLPTGEQILWQGAPDAWRLARGAFRLGPVAVYFLLLAAWRAGSQLATGAPVTAAFTTAAWFVPLGVGALLILALLAWAHARATVYTITNRRVILKIGVALPITMNLPFGKIASAFLRTNPDGSGDIPLELVVGERVPYWALWPHARPWRYTRPEPMLRAIPDAASVAGILADALATTGGSAQQPGTTAPASRSAWAGSRVDAPA